MEYCICIFKNNSSNKLGDGERLNYVDEVRVFNEARIRNVSEVFCEESHSYIPRIIC